MLKLTLSTLAFCALTVPAWATPGDLVPGSAINPIANPAIVRVASDAQDGVTIRPRHHKPVKGVPLRGIGVSLGKVPKGGCAARSEGGCVLPHHRPHVKVKGNDVKLDQIGN